MIDLSTRQMRAFLALERQRNFTRAAAEVHLSQPAFSAMMRSLEDVLGHQLILRGSRGVHFTPAGQRFAHLASALIDSFDAGLASIRDALDPSNRIRLAAMVALTYEWLPPILATLKACHPKLHVEFEAVFPKDCLTLVTTGDVELAVTAVEEVPDGIAIEPLWHDPFHLVCRVDHPLATSDTVSLDDVVRHPFVHYAPNTLARRQIDRALDGRRLQVHHESEHIHTIRALVDSGIGISLATEMNRRVFETETLTMIPLKEPALTRLIAVARQAQRPVSASAQLVIDVLRQTARDRSP